MRFDNTTTQSIKASPLESRPLTVLLILSSVSILIVLNPVVLRFLFGFRHLPLMYIAIFDAVIFIFGVYFPLLAIKTGRIWLLTSSIMALGILPILTVAPDVLSGYRHAEKAKLTYQRIASERDPLFQAHLLLGWWHPPNAKITESTPNYTAVYETDSLGRKKVEQGSRAIHLHFFGDSFIFGYGVSNRDSALQMLANNPAARVAFLNYGVAGYGLEQIFVRFRSALAEMHKGDIVVFTVIYDDVRRNPIEGSFICNHALHFGAGVERIPVFQNFAWEFPRIWEQCSYIASLIRFSELPLGKHFKLLYERYEAITKGKVLEQNALNIIHQAKTLASANGLGFIVMLFPGRGECLARANPLDNWPIENLVSLTEFCPRSAEEVNHLYYPEGPWNGHWNVEGNRWAAQAIERILTRQHIL